MSYTWTVTSMVRDKNTGGVFSVELLCVKTETVNSIEYSAKHGFNINLVPDPDSSSFVDYNNLTESTVLSWLNTDYKSEIEKLVEDLLEQEKSSAIGVPW